MILKDKYNKKRLGVPRVLSMDDTIDYICENRCSVSRYGDGEFKIVSGERIRFQEYDPLLAKRLADILKEDSNYFVCISNIFDSLEWMESKPYEYTWRIIAENREKWMSAINKDKIYGNAFISRPYLGWKDKSRCEIWFDKLKKIWEQKDIVIVEGEKSRLGYSNDLFSNTCSIKRILCPVTDAFNVYEKILNEVSKIDKDKLIILALNSTATVLAYDLSHLGYWALDLGHMDIEYEWFLQKATKKVLVKGKYTNEAVDGDVVDDLNDSLYLAQIVSHVN